MVERATMRVAAIDCGTNSIRLLIADIDGTNFREVIRLMEVVRLGQGVDKTGQFHPDAIARTLAAVDIYAQRSLSAVLKRLDSAQPAPLAMPPTVIYLSKAYSSV
jgi:exopolyphosphatase/pppGpp-phosphohydrolase